MAQLFSNVGNVNLLWTGGWDSTFQLLRLLFIYRSRVTPFYLIDAERRSTGAELLAMKHIKEQLIKESPFIAKIIQPTRYFAVADISSDYEITQAFNTVRKNYYLGDQYAWLATFCKENKIKDIQLCIHKDDKAHNVIEQIVTTDTDCFRNNIRISDQFADTDEYRLFRYFSFPIFNFTKQDMLVTANENHWEHLMNMTWFCHNPTKKMTPCGKCNPCKYTIDEGLAWRIPVRRRPISFFYNWIFHRITS